MLVRAVSFPDVCYVTSVCTTVGCSISLCLVVLWHLVLTCLSFGSIVMVNRNVGLWSVLTVV